MFKLRGRIFLSRRARWSLADQALSSLSNFGVSALAAHALTAAQFGAYGIAFTVYLIGLWIMRSYCGEPLVVRSSPRDTNGVVPGMLSASLAIGCGIALVVAGATLAIVGPLRVALQALAMVLPLLLLQDAYRYVFLARGAPKSACLVDLLWCIAQGTAVLLLVLTDRATLTTVIITWGGGAGVAALAMQMRERPGMGLADARLWLQDISQLGHAIAVDALVLTGGQQLLALALATVAGLPEVGSLRAATIALGPVVMFTAGIGLFTLPESARVRDRDVTGVPAIGLFHSASIVVVAALALGLILIAPASLGTAVLADRFSDAREIAPYLALQIATGGAAGGPMVCLRALEHRSAIYRLRLIATPLTVTAGTIGIALAAVKGMAIGVAIVNSIAFVAAWNLLTTETRRRSARDAVRPLPSGSST